MSWSSNDAILFKKYQKIKATFEFYDFFLPDKKKKMTEFSEISKFLPFFLT